MIGRTNTGGGGGGGGLNFRIIGGTVQPASAKENDIWVNTSTKIESWIFSATQPISPVAGMVWIEIGVASSVAFNLLKKNAAYTYPLSCKQYVGGEWANREAHIYQGEWLQFSSLIVYLYNNGETSLTWVGQGTNTASALVLETKRNLYEGSYSSNGWKGSAETVTVPSGMSKLCIKYSVAYTNGSLTGSNHAFFGLMSQAYSSSYPGASKTNYVAYADIPKSGNNILAEVPLTDALYGNSYYIGMFAGTGSVNSTVESKWSISEIWFE